MNERERQAAYEADRVRRRAEAAEGRRLRDEAIAQVDEHANPDWKDDAYAAVVQLTETMSEFTTDDVWYSLKDSQRGATHERRAMGAIMRKAARAGLIEPTERYLTSTRAICHSAPKRVWRSVR